MYNSNDAFEMSINDAGTRLIYSVCNFPVLKFYSRGSSGSLMIWPVHGAKTSLPVSLFHTHTHSHSQHVGRPAAEERLEGRIGAKGGGEQQQR